MPQNSVPQNTFGINSTVPSPTVPRKDLAQLKGRLRTTVRRLRGDPRSFSGPVSMLLTSHGPGGTVYFHYLCKTQ